MRAHASLLAALVSMPAFAASPVARIELLPDARVSTSVVVLGDVARLRSQDLELLRRLVHLPLGSAPVPGEAGHLLQSDLANWIRRQARIAPETLAWSGASGVRVVREVARIDGQELARTAVEAAQSWLGEQGLAGAAYARMTPRDLTLDRTGAQLRARAPNLSKPRANVVIWVDVRSGGEVVRTVPVSVGLTSLDASAAPGAVLPKTSKETELAPRPAAGLSNVPLAVSRGEWATLRAASGAVILERRVEVLQDGRAGQNVPVRSPGATGQVLARVVAPGYLELAP